MVSVRGCRARRRATAFGWRDGVEWDPRRGRRRRWASEPLRWNLDLILDQLGADMADLPDGASARLQRQTSRSAGNPHRPRSSLAGRRTARSGAPGRRGSGPVEDPRQEPKVIDASPAAISLARICDPGKDRGDGAEGVGAATGIGTGAEGLSMSAVSLRQQLFTVWKCHHSRRYGHRPL
jgi:hypothetical protein